LGSVLPPLAMVACSSATFCCSSGIDAYRASAARPAVNSCAASACMVTIVVSISLSKTCNVSGVEMTVPRTTASAMRGTAMPMLRSHDGSCDIPTSSIRSRLTITRPQPRPISVATAHGAPSAMWTANAADSAASPPVLSSTPPSATNFDRAPGATASRSSRAPARTAKRSPER
jgi:hypothetical protein